MKIATMLAMIVGTILGATAMSANAATITWSSTAYVNTGSAKNTMGTGQFDETGIEVYVENTGDGATTFDGISYSAGAIDFGGSTTVYHQAANLVSRSGTFSGSADTVTLGVGGVGTIVSGATYRVQLLLMDGRGTGSLVGRYVEVDGIDQGIFGNGISGSTWGDALLVTGTFIADANTQDFGIEIFNADTTSVGSQLNALLLHQTAPPPAPEPTSIVLAGLAIGGLCVRRRRRS